LKNQKEGGRTQGRMKKQGQDGLAYLMQGGFMKYEGLWW